MKTKIVLLLATMLLFQVVNAQRYGIKAGINFANMNFSGEGGTFSAKSITGFHAGPIADFNIKDGFFINTGLLYSLKGTKEELGIETEKVHLNYLEIPVNAAYKFLLKDDSRFFVQAGPYFGYGISGKVKDGTSTDVFKGTNALKRFDFGIGFGAGVEYHSFILGLTYELGLNNLSDASGITTKNKVFEISLGYLFASKK